MSHAAHRDRLPTDRESVTRKFTIGNTEVYIIVGFYGSDDPRVGEVFIKLAKHGSDMSGLTDTIALLLSMGLQYGIPWEVLFKKLRHMRFGPDTPNYSSLCDALALNINKVIQERNARVGVEDTVSVVEEMPDSGGALAPVEEQPG